MPQSSRSADIVLVLSNEPLPKIATTYEHLPQDTGPEWRFAAIADAESFPAEAIADTSPEQIIFHARRHGPKVGADAAYPVVLWVVLTNAVDGKDAEFNDWYDNRHLDDVVAVPGLISAQRYQITRQTGDTAATWAYLALYEVDPDNAAGIIAEVRSRAGGPSMPNPGYLAPGTMTVPFRPRA